MPGHTQRTVPRPHSRGSKQAENSALGCRFSACSWSSLSDAVHMNVWRHILHTIVCAAAFTFSWLCADDLAAARFRLRSRFCLARFPFPDGILMSFCSSRTTKKTRQTNKKNDQTEKKTIAKKVLFLSLFCLSRLSKNNCRREQKTLNTKHSKSVFTIQPRFLLFTTKSLGIRRKKRS